MRKVPYTVRTEGSRTVVHWERKSGKVEVRPATTGRFVERHLESSEPEIVPEKDAGRRKKKR